LLGQLKSSSHSSFNDAQLFLSQEANGWINCERFFHCRYLIAFHPRIVIQSPFARFQFRAKGKLFVLGLGDRLDAQIEGKSVQRICRDDQGWALLIQIEKTHITPAGIPSLWLCTSLPRHFWLIFPC